MRVVKKPEERRAEMVAAAAKLFAQQGFVRTSVAEIVSAVDVAKGLFYYYFTTKDDMVKAVVEGYCSYLGTVAQQIADGEGDGCEKFARLMEHEAWQQCFTAPLTADLCLPQHAALYTDMCDRVYTHMRPALEQMAAQALREKGADEREAGRLVGVGLYGLLMLARRGEMTMEQAREMVGRLIGSELRAA
ncbi:MAG TPA: TetR/AcrR family transcriptional regulator [Candidatus Ventricola intestinavium]|nr:TetR/AcrR family transcriptional regulator [Candidatus Ventricola intestinavium]